jgi:pimeloyl-ACP methyl ester carboxylesterase
MGPAWRTSLLLRHHGPVRQRVAVRDTELAVDVTGDGEPLLVVQTALDVDELAPLARRLGAGGRHRVIQYHRRGYGQSPPAGAGVRSVTDEAVDCAALLGKMALGPAHVVGASYSAAIALTLAADFPQVVRTLAVMEPPPVHVPSSPEFLRANARLLERYEAEGPVAALDELQTLLVGPDWRAAYEQERPGPVRDLERDAATFFSSDAPALVRWSFGPEDAARIRCPVLHVGGSDSGPWFAEVRGWVHALLPHAEDAVVGGADHLLARTHADRVAELVLDFLDRHAAT